MFSESNLRNTEPSFPDFKSVWVDAKLGRGLCPSVASSVSRNAIAFGDCRLCALFSGFRTPKTFNFDKIKSTYVSRFKKSILLAN
jgi:hypothetical protein